MRTKSRLNKVYEDAVKVPFDDDSRLVFFSDIHRSDDSLADEFGRNKHIYNYALNYYYQVGFTYVELGDGDELWEQPRFEHIRNAHAVTFNRLKQFYDDDRMYMIFGNHNMQLKHPQNVEKLLYRVYDEYEEKKIDLFPGIKVYEALRFVHKKTGQEIFAVHGHQGDLLNDQLAFISFFGVRFLWHFLHIVGVKYAASPAKSRRKRHKVEKNYAKWNQEHNEIIICGHTHRPKFPNVGEDSYFNTGCCMHPGGITCLELVDGKIVLVTWRVHTRKKDGTMYIKRTALKGPVPIKNYVKESKKDEL